MASDDSSVFGDPSYAQKAIAASPYAAMGGYITGGLCWMIIPWALGTSGGLAALALSNNPAFPTYPNVPPLPGLHLTIANVSL